MAACLRIEWWATSGVHDVGSAPNGDEIQGIGIMRAQWVGYLKDYGRGTLMEWRHQRVSGVFRVYGPLQGVHCMRA